MITAIYHNHAVEVINTESDGTALVHSILSEPIAQTYKGGSGFIGSEWAISAKDELTDVRTWSAEKSDELWVWVDMMAFPMEKVSDEDSILTLYHDQLDLLRD
ncbi:hypothetical protein CCP3SC15_2440006 [Gammaproteobacteria bacterium]